jgi:hypothetical protein
LLEQWSALNDVGMLLDEMLEAAPLVHAAIDVLTALRLLCNAGESLALGLL